jgi:hypothetical protein
MRQGDCAARRPSVDETKGFAFYLSSAVKRWIFLQASSSTAVEVA